MFESESDSDDFLREPFAVVCGYPLYMTRKFRLRFVLLLCSLACLFCCLSVFGLIMHVYGTPGTTRSTASALSAAELEAQMQSQKQRLLNKVVSLRDRMAADRAAGRNGAATHYSQRDSLTPDVLLCLAETVSGLSGDEDAAAAEPQFSDTLTTFFHDIMQMLPGPFSLRSYVLYSGAYCNDTVDALLAARLLVHGHPDRTKFLEIFHHDPVAAGSEKSCATCECCGHTDRGRPGQLLLDETSHSFVDIVSGYYGDSMAYFTGSRERDFEASILTVLDCPRAIACVIDSLVPLMRNGSIVIVREDTLHDDVEYVTKLSEALGRAALSVARRMPALAAPIDLCKVVRKVQFQYVDIARDKIYRAFQVKFP